MGDPFMDHVMAENVAILQSFTFADFGRVNKVASTEKLFQNRDLTESRAKLTWSWSGSVHSTVKRYD
jgi:hypothetical protein